MAKVTIYTSAYCGYCSRAKRLLDSKAVAYDEISVDQDPAVRKKMVEITQRTSVPQIFIDQHHVGGCDELYLLERQSKLDGLLAGQT